MENSSNSIKADDGADRSYCEEAQKQNRKRHESE